MHVEIEVSWGGRDEREVRERRVKRFKRLVIMIGGI